LICQKNKGNFFDFNLLAVPKSYFLDKSHSFAKLGDNINLELSTEDTEYKGYKVARFDDICCTRNLNTKPIPFAQFDLGY
jgi:hypothetical protein